MSESEPRDVPPLEPWIKRLDGSYDVYKRLKDSDVPFERHLARVAFLQAAVALEVIDYQLTGNPEVQ